MTPNDYCREKAARPGSSVYYSALFAPEERRQALVATSAFCREITDITREPRDSDVARTKLAWWRSEIASLYEGAARHPVALALAQARERYALDARAFEDIVAGAEMDLDYNAYPDFAALEVYCRRVGGALARLWAETAAGAEVNRLDAAAELGVAFRLTQIIRSVGEDARRNRIYLPLHEMAEHGVTSEDLVHARENDNFRRLMAFQVDRAERRYQDAIAKLPVRERKAQRPLLAAAAINRALLAEIRSDGYTVLTRRTSLTPLRKLWLAWRAPYN